MLTVSLLIEILRTKPRLMFWLAALAQGALWLIVPALVYSAPPGNVAELLAAGREMSFASAGGAPLAPMLAELALRLARGHMIGVYLLSQICIVVAYWAVFQLGRAIVGDRQAVLAILLMVGVSFFTVSSPDFGPDILMMPLWALALLFLWRTTGQGRQLYGIAFAGICALMLFTSPLSLMLIALAFVFIASTERGRHAVMNVPTVGAAMILLMAGALLLFYLRHNDMPVIATLAPKFEAGAVDQRIIAMVRLVGIVVVAQAGAAILIALASNLSRTRRTEAAAITGTPADPFARLFVYYFALVPLIVALVFGAILGKNTLAGIPPLLILSGLAIVVAAGDVILVHHQRVLGIVWFSFLLVPPALVALAVLFLPSLFAVDLKVAQPADEIARYFTDSFERRTGRKLDVVGGDARLASIIALASGSRPRVLSDAGQPQRASLKDAETNGAIIVWRATDNAGTPPPQIKEQFPSIVPEVPRAFERAIAGRAPLLRIGWGMIRPQSTTPPTASGQ